MSVSAFIRYSSFGGKTWGGWRCGGGQTQDHCTGQYGPFWSAQPATRQRKRALSAMTQPRACVYAIGLFFGRPRRRCRSWWIFRNVACAQWPERFAALYMRAALGCSLAINSWAPPMEAELPGFFGPRQLAMWMQADEALRACWPAFRRLAADNPLIWRRRSCGAAAAQLLQRR
ncbi:unnamed protein product [Prorocentrum cordatum]|uniref:Uncharacterized protein n=1 Tax=Prorocentrum cordatum TaxID=2364126 RepID=A0ABN9TEF6_9DINO|nr:unnamed protein product [Polarella glacialis]